MASKKKGYSKSYYSKKPLWQWILIYLIVGGVVYFVIYYLFLARNKSNSYAPNNPTTSVYTLPGY